MAASIADPHYSVYIVSGGTKYNITSLLTELSMNESRNQIAQSATIRFMNVWMGGNWLSASIKVRDRVFIYANDGSRNAEVFRGFIWTRDYNSALTEREITLRCYDNLIYLQESQASEFFASGKSTKDIVSTICDEWGIKLEYEYESITHTKLALRGDLADILTTDILDLVKAQTGKKYVLLSDQDTMRIKTIGTNSTLYKIASGGNAVSTVSTATMDGMTTKVVILGKADKEERRPVEATVTKNTDEYGTLQKIINRDKDTTIEEAKEEANNILKDEAQPKQTYEVVAPDIPWIRKGDKVLVNAGDIQNRTLIVTALSRAITAKSKHLELTLADEGQA